MVRCIEVYDDIK